MQTDAFSFGRSGKWVEVEEPGKRQKSEPPLQLMQNVWVS